MARIQPQFDGVQFVSYPNGQNNYISGSAILFIRGNPNDDGWNRQDISFLVPKDNAGNPFTLETRNTNLGEGPICSVWPGTFHTESGVDNDHGWGVDTFSINEDASNTLQTIVNARIVVRGRHATMVRIGFQAMIPGDSGIRL